MQQRRLRLGDILDDYCPRERRITNHAVVAMIDDDVKQTRCTTCDADHEYKHGKAPAPRRKKAAGALSTDAAEALESRPVLTASPAPADEPAAPDMLPEDHDAPVADEPHLEAHDATAPEHETPEPEMPEQEPSMLEDEGPVHRRLIRATLPRPEGQPPERKEPDFTFRQHGGRGFDHGNRNGHRTRGGHRGARGAQGQGGQAHFGGQRQGQSGGQGAGQRQAPGNRAGRPGGQDRAGQRHGGHGRKRGR
jgi:hypothetical protein